MATPNQQTSQTRIKVYNKLINHFKRRMTSLTASAD